MSITLEFRFPAGTLPSLRLPQLSIPGFDGRVDVARVARAVLPVAAPGLALAAEAAGLGPAGRILLAIALKTVERSLAE
jgi:hypothetical protein